MAPNAVIASAWSSAYEWAWTPNVVVTIAWPMNRATCNGGRPAAIHNEA
jgi:hypothetical protein